MSTAYLIFSDYEVETSTENVSSATEFHKTRVFLNEISSLKSTLLFGKKTHIFFTLQFIVESKKKNLACTELMNSVTEFSSQKGLSPPGPL